MSAFGDSPGFLVQAIHESRINSTFETFLASHINISTSIRSSASVSQNSLREFLRGESSRDLSGTFPVILQKNDCDFIAGSFGRHTKIWPLDDIDLLFPLDGAGLAYFRGGVETNHKVVSDGAINENPLLTPRWMSGSYISSARVISEFSKVLQRRYPKSSVRKDGEAISVQLTMGASNESDGLKFDVVPCIRLEPRDGSAAFYLIPDGRDGWKNTNPRADQELCDDLHRFHDGLYRKVVKLIKYWNINQLDGALGSYYLELALANHFHSMKALGQRAASIGEGVKLGFQALWNATRQGNIPSPVKDAPSIQMNALSAPNGMKLVQAVSGASNALVNKAAGRVDWAISGWKSIFGPEFDQ